MKTYDELFELRGSAYDRAMQRYPHARDKEFAQALARAELKPGMVVADVPAGGGYLQHYLLEGCIWWGHEPCASFTNHCETKPAHKPLLPLPWPDASVDVAISLAGVHHIEDKRPLFAELCRVVKSDGRLVLSDVQAGSAVAGFLDGYVGGHNSTGHKGVFVDEHTLAELTEMGWALQSCEQIDFHWVFPDLQAMAEFCHELFDLRHSSLHDTEQAIKTQLGVVVLGSGEVGMNWSLLTIVAKRL